MSSCSRRLQPAATFLFLASLLAPIPAHAAIQWSLSVVQGYYLPRLDELNYVLKHERVELGPQNREARPSPYPVIYQGRSPEMPEMSPTSPKIGLQLQADINPRYAAVFGGSIATFDSTKRDVRPFFVGFWIPANRETRFSLSLNQLWLGIKRYWIWEKKSPSPQPSPVKGEGVKEGITPQSIPSPLVGEGKGGGGPESRDRPSGLSSELGVQSLLTLHSIKEKTRLYAEFGILAITRAYLTTDVWMHVYAPDEGFDFYKVTETGINGSGYATYLGAGGEYYIRKWLSIGLDIDYTIGRVGEMKYDYYFTIDPLEKDIIKPGDDVLYTDFRKGRIAPLFLDLEGWDFKGQVRVYF